MKYIEIPITKAVLFLTEKELLSLLGQNVELYKEALSRGKAFQRHRQQKERERQKWEGL